MNNKTPLDVELLKANMTASGPDLRLLIETHTGADALTDPAFVWSNELPCDECGIHDSTAIIGLDDDNGDVTMRRLCAECFRQATS